MTSNKKNILKDQDRMPTWSDAIRMSVLVEGSDYAGDCPLLPSLLINNLFSLYLQLRSSSQTVVFTGAPRRSSLNE